MNSLALYMNNFEEQWCQDQVWKKDFKFMSFKSVSIGITFKVLQYLELDSFIVDTNDDEDEVQEYLKSEEMKNFVREIANAIETVGGKGVVPRLNWSCPK